MDWKLIGYAVSSLSVLLLGVAAWPDFLEGYEKPLLVAGMATSVAGMVCRYISHLKDKEAIAYAQQLTRSEPSAPALEKSDEKAVRTGGE